MSAGGAVLEAPIAVDRSRAAYTTRHLAALDGLRGIAIALVMAYHFWLISWYPTTIQIFGANVSFDIFAATGMTGVTLFFFISGFCLFYPYAQTLFDGRPLQSTGMFAYRRMLKILPSYYLGLVLWLVLGFASFGTWDETARQILTHVFFIHTFWTDSFGGINGVLWSLAIEVQFYVVFPLIAWCAMRRPLPTFAALVLIANAYRLLVWQHYDAVHEIVQLPGTVDVFGSGMLAAWLYRAIAARRPALAARRGLWTAVAVAGFAIWYAALVNMYAHRSDARWLSDWNVYTEPALALAFATATVGSLLAFPWWQRALGNPVLLFLSYVSYNLYLWHQLIADRIVAAKFTSFEASSPDPTPGMRIAYTAAFVAGGIAVAWVITTFVEQPLLRRRPFQSLFFDRTKELAREAFVPPAAAVAAPMPASTRRAAPRSGVRSRVAAFWRRHGELVSVVLVSYLVALFSSHFRSTQFNNYTRLADAMRHGHMWIDYPGAWLDAILYNGQHYVVDGPFPALLMFPLVFLYGADANQTTMALLVAALCMGLAHQLLVRLHVARVPRLFLLLFLFAGTDLWWCAELGDVWFMAHLCAMTAVFGAFLELTGKRRGWVIGLLSIAAFFSRNVELFGIGFFAYALWTGDLARATTMDRGEPDPRPIDRRRAFFSLGTMLSLGVLLWIGYNEASWGTLVDVGHTVYFHQDSWGQKTGSPFQLIYVPYQIYSYFFRAPIFVEWLQQAQWPVLKVDTSGVALTFTSPALIMTFLAKRPNRLVIALWLATAGVAAPEFLYYLNGWYQFGMRHALDFEPYLFVLMALGVRDRMPRWGMILCVYSALAGAWGVWWWNTFMRTGT